MADLQDGQTVEVKGSAAAPYVLRNTGGVYSCTCPAWRNQSIPIERRTCKHLKALRGEAAETDRVGGEPVVRATTVSSVPTPTSDAPGVLLAHRWDQLTDVAGWWMSEKLDGVRAWWDGRRFLSRLGHEFRAPSWFTAALPEHPLDGELWAGRRLFQQTVSVVRRQDASEEWRRIRYLVFDAPQAPGPFEARLDYLQQHLGGPRGEFVTIVEHQVCQGVDHLRRELAAVEALGGEGLMLRRPGSLYEAGRSTTLLKIKTFQDAEARVVGHQAGAGRHQGRLGALLVETPEGTRFSVGTGFSDAEREAPPPVGSIITYRFQELSDGGVPRFPSYVGVRTDIPFVSLPPKRPTPAPPPATSPPLPASPSAPRRRFEFVAGTSSKFWEIALSGSSLTTSWGRIGTGGQSKEKTFASAEAASREAEKLTRDKQHEGYQEVDLQSS